MDKSIIRSVLEALYAVREHVPNREYGLCMNLELANPAVLGIRAVCHAWLVAGFRCWPHFSGNYLYPVPHPLEAAYGFRHTVDMWAGEYGELRKDLMRFLIQLAERQLTEE